MRYKTFFILGAILFLAAILRLHTINWDQGFHMHPDERAIILSVINLHFPKTLATFMTPDSTWNPHFFAYGSFPFYLLRIAGNLCAQIQPTLGDYTNINLVGRVLSTLFDLGTVLLLFFLGKQIGKRIIGLLAAFFYATCVLPIQLSHFYAVDTLLTFFITATLYLLIRYAEKPTPQKALLIGIATGLALATKISAIILIVPILVTISIDIFHFFLQQSPRPHKYLVHLSRYTPRYIKHGGILLVAACFTFLFCEPYAFIDFPTFRDQTYQQSLMTKDAFTFPYTLQYVGKIPYFYELKNIILWGQGVPLAILTIAGLFFVTLQLTKKKRDTAVKRYLILLIFFWVYVAIVGKFAIGFMRYMLPLYPLLCLFGGIFTYETFLSLRENHRKLLHFSVLIVFLSLLIWPLSFQTIYAKPSTRVSATDWIRHHIAPGSTIAIEHWDDALPLIGQENYQMHTLPLYDPETPEKWQEINQVLSKTDYIILASNRLYVPLMKLTDCQHLPPGRCYPQTAAYYKKLFNGALGFKEIAEFAVYPTIPFLHIPINDQPADESFTVYDHPKVIIFQKEK